jgi:hypothetical protein
MLRVPITASWRRLGIFAPPRKLPWPSLSGRHRSPLVTCAEKRYRSFLTTGVTNPRGSVLRPHPGGARAGRCRSYRIEVLFALGAHRPMTLSETQAKIGRENLAAHRWHNHNCFDLGQMTRLGTTARGTRLKWLAPWAATRSCATLQPAPATSAKASPTSAVTPSVLLLVFERPVRTIGTSDCR